MKSFMLIALIFMASVGAASAEQVQSAPVVSAALSEEELDAARGGQETTINAVNRTTLAANNSGNSITAGTVTSGAISIDSDAFSGFDGVGNFVTNTGNNNNLQGSISITVIVTP